MSPRRRAHGSELHGYPISRTPITFDLRQEQDLRGKGAILVHGDLPEETSELGSCGVVLALAAAFVRCQNLVHPVPRRTPGIGKCRVMTDERRTSPEGCAAAPRTSIVVIGYNQERYIAQSIESVLAQDRK